MVMNLYFKAMLKEMLPQFGYATYSLTLSL